MPKDLNRTFLGILKGAFAPSVTRPGFANLVVVAVGWILSHGTHSVTQALVATSVPGRRHHEAFHRFFSRGAWDPDQLGHGLFRLLAPWGGDVVRIVVDDTLAPRKGPHVFGLGTHLDAVRSTKKFRVFTFGHCWVVLAVLVEVPFSSRSWALPLLFRLYRNEKECRRNKAAYRKKTELARDMLDVFLTWTADRRVEVAADSAYCNDTVTRGLQKRLVLFGSMRPDAVLTDEPPGGTARAGRPRKRGITLPKPQAVAEDSTVPWKSCTAMLYGRLTKVRYKTFCAQWYRACGVGLLRIVIVQCTVGRLPFRVYFSTDASLSVVRILETYAGRWGIEVFFREAKQAFGFADSSARKSEAVLRVAPFVGLLYSALVLWFLEGAHRSSLARPPLRPWYTHKRGFCFNDALRAAQRSLATLDVLDPANSSVDFHQPRRPRTAVGDSRRREAA
jgi:hypothetical protein